MPTPLLVSCAVEINYKLFLTKVFSKAFDSRGFFVQYKAENRSHWYACDDEWMAEGNAQGCHMPARQPEL